MGYAINRERVYKIYGINIDDKNYNCHHIVTREDVKKGLVEPNFDLHSLSNLIPLKIRDHNDLHRRINNIEKNIFQNSDPTKTPKDNLNSIENTKRTVNIHPLWSIVRYQQRKEETTRLDLLTWKRSNLCDY